MCTLTILPRPDAGSASHGARVAFNRDELRARAPGTDPALEQHGSCLALLPRDPEGGGTWLAATDLGLVFTLLNINPARAAPTGGASRGSIIPGALEAGSLAEVEKLLPRLSAPVRRPFRLVVTDGTALLEAIGGGGSVKSRRTPLDRPFMRCSSGVGDATVEPHRSEAFDRLFMPGTGDPVAAQNAFHRHRCLDDEACSIDMSRDDACTVSWTVVELGSHSTRMTHYPGAPREERDPIEHTIPLADQSGRPTEASVE